MPGGHARVRFDETAVAEDLANSGGADVLADTKQRYEHDGVPTDSLRACDAEARDGTSLPGCIKVYLPPPDGRFGMVLRLVGDEQGLALAYVAFGARHQPPGSHAPTVYQVAHRRLND